MKRTQATRYSAGGHKRPTARRRTFTGAALLTCGLSLIFLLAKPRRLSVHGSSMEPYLADGDRILVARWPGLRQGDVVALADPRDPRRTLVKRVDVVAHEGVWVLGDNAPASTDSRDFGTVPRRMVKGRAVYRYHPAQRAGHIRREKPTRRGNAPASRPNPPK